jgi:hypothetical protein
MAVRSFETLSKLNVCACRFVRKRSFFLIVEGW